MRMGVFRVRRGVDPMPIHLPNYDTYNTLNPASLPRISTSISPTEAAENANEVKATMELAENAKSTISEIAARFRQRVDALRQTLQRQQAVLSSLPDNSKSVVDVARKLGENASKAGAAQQNEALTKLGASITAMAVSLENTTRAVNDLNGSISKTVIGFTKVTVGATSPDAVLRNILGLTTNTVGDVVGRAKDVQDQLTKIDESLKDIESAAGGLGPGQADGLALAQRVRKEIVGAITGTLDQLLQLPDSVDEAIRTVQSNAGDAAPLLDLKAPEILTVSDIVPTRLEIPRTDPSDGDVLDVAAQIFQGDKLVYEEHRSITVRFYGWHSGLSSGLVFVRSADHVGSNFKPEAAAVWRIRYTPRPGSRNPLGNLRPGVGIHATTLHFNSSVDDDATASNGANNIQFGVGLTFHLFGDVLQTGYGWNLGVQKDRSYTYLGIGIMKVLKQLLSERQ
jgi:ABC-type transporter Mla subunit MlaD